MKATTRSEAHIANSAGYKWTPMDIRVEFNTHVNEGIVASSEILLTKANALELIEELKKVLDKLNNR
jgi:hypothetical protein